MVEHREVLVLYTNATCNLNCTYCAIDKNPALVSIDELLKESFEDENYYIDFAKDIFPNPNQLRRVETWGGEPFLSMHRALPTMRKLIEYYPNLHEFFSSSNVVSHQFHEEFYGLLRMFGEYPDRKFMYNLQISLDGPTEINDRNRGKGVTQRIYNSVVKLFKEIEDVVPDNVLLRMHFKPTLDSSGIRLLQSKEAIIEYYRFFETYLSLYTDTVHKENIIFDQTLPNTASPGMHDKEEGELFANLVRLCKEIECENQTDPVFKHYKVITPYLSRRGDCGIACEGGTCGSCRTVLGLLPGRQISGCHGAFVDLITDYKHYVIGNDHSKKVIDFNTFSRDAYNYFCFDEKKLPEKENFMELYYKPGTTARLSSVKSMIQVLAYAGQIDPVFKDPQPALVAANYIGTNVANCMKDNLGASGTVTLPCVGILRLLLNGAHNYLFGGDLNGYNSQRNGC